MNPRVGIVSVLVLGAAATVAPWPWDKGFLIPLAAVAWMWRAEPTILRSAAVVALTQVVGLLPAAWLIWPLPLLPALLGAWRLVPGEFAQRGAVDRRILPWVSAIVGVSSTALVVWLYGLHPDISDLQAMLARFPTGLVVLGAVGFPVINALMEELIWRGIYWGALERAGFGAAAVLGIQAVSFGFAHWNGFPRGPVGVLLASIYGAMLGGLRWRTGGLVVPVLTHIVADVTIFVLLATYTG